MMAASWDDDELFEALREVFRAQEDAPPNVAGAAKKAFGLYEPDAEFAQLSYDSLAGAGPAAGVRGDTAAARALTLSSEHATIELEFTSAGVLGQVVPPRYAAITVQLTSGSETAVPADEIGCFSIRPIPAAAFRLRCERDGQKVLTEWVVP